MKKQFDILRATRDNVLKVIKGLDIEQLNHIPEDFRNNITWNVAHLPVTLELLCYGKSDLAMHLSEEQIASFRKGSRPERPMQKANFEFFCEELITGVDQLEQDYNDSLFETYNSYTTSYGVELNSIEDAIQFNYAHEALHLGYIMALKRVVR